ncbi:MAG: hypothetical protein J5725_00985 [Bacteroidales bacterium]|nr:hypothetical protein [Bacteroidales bacterium]
MADIRTEIRNQLKKSEVLKNASYLEENEFYFNRVEEGIYQHSMLVEHALMFKKGSGSELQDSKDNLAKAKAVDSSSMLSYNFFNWVSEKHPLCLFNVKYTRVSFEVRLKTLKSSNAPANIDVILVDKENRNVLFIESKFLEYLKNEKADFSSSYTELSNYFADNKSKENLITLVEKYNGKYGDYYDGIKQNICHIIALCNLEDEKAREYAKEKNPNLAEIFETGVNYNFINLIFDPCLDAAKKKYDNYVRLLEEFRKNISFCKKFLIDNRIFMSYSNLYQEFAKQNSPLPKDLLDYLNKRYIDLK